MLLTRHLVGTDWSDARALSSPIGHFVFVRPGPLTPAIKALMIANVVVFVADVLRARAS